MHLLMWKKESRDNFTEKKTMYVFSEKLKYVLQLNPVLHKKNLSRCVKLSMSNFIAKVVNLKASDLFTK